MNKVFRIFLQGLSYAAFVAVIWYFSSEPAFQHMPADKALVVVAFKHAGLPVEACRKMTQQELDLLSPNMRKVNDCTRQRSPIHLQLFMDGDILFDKIETPPGIYADGSVNIYYSRKVATGKHDFVIKIKDSVRADSYTYMHQHEQVLDTAQILVISFTRDKGFVFN
ncbi:MAG: hypothetical protein L3J22_00115 [Xanthomonadales bacterium]|nr:hypothetical protein [Xanthomonadales bacterium]